MYRLSIRVFLYTVVSLIVVKLSAQDSLSLKYTVSKTRLGDKEVLIKIIVHPDAGTKLYGLQQKKDDAIFSTVSFDSTVKNRLDGQLVESGIKTTEEDTSLGQELAFFSDSAIWSQKVKVSETDSFTLKGTVSFMYKKNGAFIPNEQPFKVYFQPEATTNAGNNKGTTEGRSLWWIFLAAFGGGLLALLTPCVYSMIPVTVSFFTKRSKTKAKGKKNAVYYALSIIIIFTLLGFLVTIIFGPAALNNLATNWIANIIFFALFVVFGISFLGAFEITLPSSWLNKTDAKANTGSFWGIFFMALTLVLVSFSCTGPIIGNLLVLASKGNYFGPLIGMFGFSTALALPFALFAFFPSKLNVLGKAGGWLNAVKVTLGFLELALALKFFSNADLAKGWRLLDREVFISLWIVIFIFLGVYLLGRIKLHHDDDLPKNDYGLPYLSVTRLLIAVTVFAFAIYMVPGLFGAPLKGISAFVPPMGTQDFNIMPASSAGMSTTLAEKDGNSLPHPVKYYDKMKIYEPQVVTSNGMVTYFDYDEALSIARKLKKPLMLDFTGINCVNCRKMEGQVWSDPAVMKRLKEDFVIVSLYVDVSQVDLPENEQYVSKELGKKVETLGDKNADMQVKRFGANTQPYYFFVDGNEKKLADEGYGYDPDITKFISHLDTVTAKYNSSLAR